MRVTVLGGGDSAFATAFHLVQLGHDVCMYVHPESKSAIADVEESGRIVAVKEHDGLTSPLHGESRIEQCVTDMEDALNYSNMIFMAVPVAEQMRMFQVAYPNLVDQKTMIIIPGGWASLQFAHYMETEVKQIKRMTFVECSISPYVCKKVGKNQVFISGMKQGIHIGVYPCERTATTVCWIKPFFNKLKLQVCANVLGPALMNIDIPTIHPACCLFNDGWIEKTGSNSKVYEEGKTVTVSKLAEAVDAERVEVAKELGHACLPALENIQFCYGETNDKTLYDYINNAERCWKYLKLQQDDDKAMTEDLEYYYLPIIQYLAQLKGVDTPVMKAVVSAAESLLRKKLTCERHFKFIVKEGEDKVKIMERLKWYHGFMS